MLVTVQIVSLFLFVGEYASMQACQDKTRPSCAPCKERFPSCRGIPNGNWPYPGQLLTSLFVKCDTERTMAVVKCMNSYFHPLTRQCGAQLNESKKLMRAQLSSQ